MNKSLANFIKQKADKIYFYWEDTNEEKFLDLANKVGSYSDWIDSQSNETLADIAELYYAGDTFMTMLRSKISKDINAWFEN